jgi:hypothetical protein
MPSGSQRWCQNWRAVAHPDAVRVNVTTRRQSTELEARLRSLPEGTPVVLSASAPGASRRCNALATRAGIEVERRYLAFPSATAPAYLVEDARASVRFFLERVLAPPPRPALALPLAAAVRILRAAVPWWGIRLVASGCVVVGRCA